MFKTKGINTITPEEWDSLRLRRDHSSAEPTRESKQQESARIARQIAEFQAAGGTVTLCEIGASGLTDSGHTEKFARDIMRSSMRGAAKMGGRGHG